MRKKMENEEKKCPNGKQKLKNQCALKVNCKKCRQDQEY